MSCSGDQSLPPADEQRRYLREALQQAASCREVPFYGVGCVIVIDDCIVAAGYTGERAEGSSLWHAEEVALAKAENLPLHRAALYSTMEPCSQRRSARASCASRIIGAAIPIVVFGTHEPFDPVLQICCEGERLLREAGVQVVHFRELDRECALSIVRARTSTAP